MRVQDALLPAERKLVEIGEATRVRVARVAFQVATREQFEAVVEQILHRKVESFASAVDAENGTLFEVFTLEWTCADELDFATA